MIRYSEYQRHENQQSICTVVLGMDGGNVHGSEPKLVMINRIIIVMRMQRTVDGQYLTSKSHP